MARPSRFRSGRRWWRSLGAVGTGALIALAALPASPVAATTPAATSTHGPSSTHQKHAAIEAGRSQPSTNGPAVVQGQQRLGFEPGDDWEPSITALGSDVYAVWTHFPQPGTFQRKRILLQASHDGGTTWGPYVVVADRPEGRPYTDQADPVLRVDLNGDVYLSFLAWGLPGDPDYTDVFVARSTDHGASFATARQVSGRACRADPFGCDKSWVAVRGGNLYVGYASGPRMIVSASHDHGATWHEQIIRDADVIAYMGGAAVDASGRAWLAWDVCTDANCLTSPVKMIVSTSSDRGGTWTNRLVATVPSGLKCPYRDCNPAFFSPQIAIAVDPAGLGVVVYDEPGNHGGPPKVVTQRSTDHGRTWTHDTLAAPSSAGHALQLFPAIAATGRGRFAVTWMDDRSGAPQHGTNGWNVFATRSVDGGRTWQDERSVSVQAPEAQWQPNGFLFPYGDYEDLTISNGRVLAIWGAGYDYIGPGNIYVRAVDWTG
jgi:BNR repeat-like domain